MKTPEEKYHNDPAYRQLTDTLESFIVQAQFTPSEVREAAMLACIHHEYYRVREYRIPAEVAGALKVLDSFATTRKEE